MNARNLLPTKTKLDDAQQDLEVCARAWASEECTSFDEAVGCDVVPAADGSGSIWEMPPIDSKRVVSLLARFEAILGGGCKLPVSAIKSGGYKHVDDLLVHLLPALRERCPGTAKPGLASTSGSAESAATSSQAAS